MQIFLKLQCLVDDLVDFLELTSDSRVLKYFFIFSPLDHINVTRICAKFEASIPSSC